jgi:hypothetical protein
MAQRKTLARVDDVDRRSRVETARKGVHEKNHKVDGAQMQKLLKKDSLVPTAVCTSSSSHTIDRSVDSLPFQNAFSEKLAKFGFCLFVMLAVDLMHEFELGVWKAVFIHLLRVLDCHDECLKHELDKR